MSFQEWLHWYSIFTLYQAACMGFCVQIGRALLKPKEPLAQTMPDLAALDWASIAFLRGGRAALTEATDLMLAARGLITAPFLESESDGIKITTGTGPSLSAIEQERWDYYQEVLKHKNVSTKPSPALLTDLELPIALVHPNEERFEKRCRVIENDLKSLHLLPSDEDDNREATVRNGLTVASIILGIFCYVMVFASHLKGASIICGVAALLVNSIVAVIFTWMWIRSPSQTALGLQFLQALAEHHDATHQAAGGEKPSEAGFALAVALYGLEGLASAKAELEAEKS